ncbi:hypothetical protein ACTMTJ_15620 [Phytohabitans sp. LJ34]|uniref:hypothetical protein n=1 Tax=Phytohabitans sp. LJ34 TaxID=3452217 RepID=UPI003F8B2815
MGVVLLPVLTTKSPLAAAASLVGAALTVEAVARWARTPPPHRATFRRAVVGAAVALGCFWGCAVYAQQTGARLAASWAADPRQRPAAVIHSTEDLRLSGACVVVTQAPGKDGDYRYRYSGFRLLIYSNQRWFLIPECWRSNGPAAAVVLVDDSRLRVELAPP